MKQNRTTQNRKWKQTIQSKTTLAEIWKNTFLTTLKYRPDFCVLFSYFIFFQKYFQIIKNQKKKQNERKKKANVIGLLWEKKLSRDLPDFEIYNEIFKTLSQSRHLPATRGDFELLIHFEKCSTQEKLFHDLGYVLLWNSGSKYTTLANTLREYVETSATSFTQYKNRCKNCEIEEKNWKKCNILNEV